MLADQIATVAQKAPGLNCKCLTYKYYTRMHIANNTALNMDDKIMIYLLIKDLGC